MRRFRMILVFALLCLVVSMSDMLVVHAKDNTAKMGAYEVNLIDDANLLTDSEESQLKDTMLQTTQYCNALFVTADKVVSSTAEYAKMTYGREFGKQNGVMFLIDMSNREIYVYAYGTAYQTIDKTNAYTITDNVYTYASASQYYECANNAFVQINALLKGGKISRPMKYISNTLLAVILSVLLNFWLLKKTSTVENLGVKNLLTGTGISYNMEKPYLKLLSRTRYSNSDNSSGGFSGGSGGGSGGGFSGGGSSGGGGGHSF